MDKENENIEFNDFMFLALDHSFESIENNASPLIPFTMTKNLGGEKSLHRYVCDRIEEGVERAKQFIDDSRSNLEMYAIAWDGYLTIENKKWDAVFVEAGVSANEKALILGQRYEKKGIIKKKNVAVGNAALVQEVPSRLTR